MEKKKGRPVKETPNTVVLPEITEVKAKTVEMNDVAFGLTTLETGQQVVVRIRYNAVSGNTGTPEIQVVGTDRMDAEERLKVALANELLRY